MYVEPRKNDTDEPDSRTGIERWHIKNGHVDMGEEVRVSELGD